MRFILACFSLFVATFFVYSSNVAAYPKATDQAQRWQLDIETGELSFYRDLESGKGYWVLVYEVTNNTGVDRQWTPNFELVTDYGEIISDGKDVPRQVQLDVLDIYGDKILKTQSNASGSLLLQGEENAIRGLVIWLAKSEQVKQIQVFIAGVSGDTANVVHPITGEQHKLHRVIQLSWLVNGRLNNLSLKPLPQRPVSGGVSVRRTTVQERDAIMGNETSRRWIFR